MVKTRKSTRNRKKNSKPQEPKPTSSKKTQSPKQKKPKNKPKITKTPPKNLTVSTSSPETSPFKGYVEEVSVPQLFDSLRTSNDEVVVPEAKDDLFNRLVDEDLPSNLHRNIKTYANKRKEKQVTDNTMSEFQNGKNRNEILQWLNDNRNVFDRITQTQSENVIPDSDSQVTFDLPSVSQQNTPKVNQVNREIKKRRRSPYKLRARSLNIQIKKNLQKGRNRSYSLAGDTPVMENYHIEEVITDEDVPVPAEREMIIMGMEDEYLDNIEREIMQSGEKKNQSATGWDRIKDINKTINSTKRQPKKLKIVLQSNENKKGGNLNDKDMSSYDHDVLENYFIENMEKLLQDESNRSNRSNVGENLNCGKFSVKNAVQVGRNFITVVKKVVESEGTECLKEFASVICELRSVFNFPVKEIATQTRVIQNCDKNLQTETSTRNGVTQTARIIYNHTSAQTDILELVEKDVQVSSVGVDIEVQTEDLDDMKKQLTKQTTTATSATPDIFENEAERQAMQAAFEEDFQNEEAVNEAIEAEEEQKSEVFDDDLNFDFNTEDFLRDELKSVKDRKENIEGAKTAESVLVVSAQSKIVNKGVKRHSESPVDSEKFPPKRPCAKFIREDLSVAFSSCADVEDRGSRNKANEGIELSEQSDGANYEYIRNVFKKYESGGDENAKVAPPPKTRTQEQIEELEEMIYNATNLSRSIEAPRNVQTPKSPSKLEDDSDYFKPAEKTPKKTRRNLFSSINDSVGTSPNVFSESLFGSDKNATVVANQTITPHNVDVIMKEHETISDKVRDEQVKVKILGNVLLGENEKHDDNVSETSDVFSDVDVVESTPQKKKFFGETDDREESGLDITLPPPLEFQDSEKPDLGHNTSKVLDRSRIFSPPRRPLAVINKITSTPITQKPDSENFPSLSPISNHRKLPELSPVELKSKFENAKNRENSKVPGPFDYAESQLAKKSPLTIVRKPQSQESHRLNSTPKQKSILTYVRTSQEHQESPNSQNSESSRKPCIACSRVTRDQVIAISALTNKKLATYSTSFSPKVTHLIVSTNEKNCLKDHTIKFVSAVAAGIWVLSFDWIEQCLAKNVLVPEEPFEALDVSGMPGPRQSRLTRKINPLFKRYKIHAAAPFASTTQQEVENVVKMLGGKVVPSPEHLLDKNGYICVIVTEARATQDFELYETWLEALKVVTVDIEWLSRSVGQYKLLSLRPFTLCSDDGIESLGYPPELTVNMTYSFSQQTFSSVPSSS